MNLKTNFCRVLCLLLNLCFVSTLLAQEMVHNTDFQEGLTSYKARDYSQALEHFKDSIPADLFPWREYEMVGYCYYHLDKIKEALTAFKKSLETNPKNTFFSEYLINPKTVPVEPISKPTKGAQSKSPFYFVDDPLLISRKRPASSYNYGDYNSPMPDDYKPDWNNGPQKK